MFGQFGSLYLNLPTLFRCDNRLPEISRIIENASDDKLPWEFVNIRSQKILLSKKTTLKESPRQKNCSALAILLFSREVLKSKKLESGWIGPYKVTKGLPHSRYELRRVGDVSGSTIIRTTVAIPSQIRLWTKEWFPDDCEKILESYFDNDTVTVCCLILFLAVLASLFSSVCAWTSLLYIMSLLAWCMLFIFIFGRISVAI